MRRTNIAFAVALLAIGYNFLPIEAPDWLGWIAALALLIIGAAIILLEIFRSA